MEAIVLAGGFGTRLRTVVNDVPKSMAAINGRPFLEYMLDYLSSGGVTRVVLSVGYKHELIIGHFGNQYRNLEIDYAVESEPLGTGGGIRLAFWKVESSRAVILNGDSMFRIDLRGLYDFHNTKKADITIALRNLENTGRYGRVSVNRNRKITGFSEKDPEAGKGLINGGVYVIEKAFLMEPWYRGRFSIEKDCFESRFSESRMFGFISDNYFLDIGIPEDYQKAQHDFLDFGD